MNKKYLYLLIILGVAANMTACSGIFKRSKKAENQEVYAASNVTRETKTKNDEAINRPAESDANPLEEKKTKGLSFQEIEGRAGVAFSEAEGEFKKKNFGPAALSYLKILRLYPASTFYRRSLYMHALSLYRNKDYTQAQQSVREALESNLVSDREHAELVMINLNLLMESKKWDEALVTSKEIAPDSKPGAAPSKAPFDVQAQALLARVVIFSHLNDQTSADHTLQEAHELISTTRGYGISEDAAKELNSELSWRKLEILAWRCQQLQPPAKMSEDELRAFLEQYYACGKEIPSLLCQTQKKSTAEVTSDGARQTFDTFLNFPRTRFHRLPPPARFVPKGSPRIQYEKEMKDFIDATVHQKTVEFRNLGGCF